MISIHHAVFQSVLWDSCEALMNLKKWQLQCNQCSKRLIIYKYNYVERSCQTGCSCINSSWRKNLNSFLKEGKHKNSTFWTGRLHPFCGWASLIWALLGFVTKQQPRVSSVLCCTPLSYGVAWARKVLLQLHACNRLKSLISESSGGGKEAAS